MTQKLLKIWDKITLHLSRHYGRFVLLLLFGCLLYLILGTCLPFLHHKKVNDAYQESFSAADFYAEDNTLCNEQVRCIESNNEALTLRLSMINSAKAEIILSTFELRTDNSGTDILAALYAAACRGVKVRLIIDGFSCYYKLPKSSLFAAFAAHENVRVKFYNPICPAFPWKAQCRLHDKYLIVDDTCYLLGGRNTYDLFLGSYTSAANEDRELLVCKTAATSEGDSLKELTDYFERIWALSDNRSYKGKANSAGKDELETHYSTMKENFPDCFITTDLLTNTIPVSAIHLLSNPIAPENKEPLVWYSLCALMASGRACTIQTPYIMASSQMLDDLSDLCATVDVSLITNGPESGANYFGSADYMNEKDSILETGLTVYEYHGEHSMHTKTILVDDRLSIVGSYNCDMRSTYLDTELMLVVDSKELNALLQEDVNNLLAMSRSPQADGTYLVGSEYTEAVLPKDREKIYAILRRLLFLIRQLL